MGDRRMAPDRAWILTAAQQRRLDEASVAAGTPDGHLMESAGTHAAEWILENLHPESAVVLAGAGGNGGDAFVVARILHRAGIPVRTFASREIDACGASTREMAERLVGLGADIDILNGDGSELQAATSDAGCVIDGLFGSGLSRPLAGDAAELVGHLQDLSMPVVSLDLPSGLASDTGVVPGVSIRADVTLAMAFYKPAHWLYPAAARCGDVRIVGVDYPEHVLASVVPTGYVPRIEEIAALLPPRPPAGHKGTFGSVLAVVGSQGMTGAAILCARGALRAGAGLVTVALPASIGQVVQSAVPEALTVLLPDREGRLVADSLTEGLMSALKSADVLAIGPGLSRNPETMQTVRRLIETYEGSLVIDADAIHALVGHVDLLTGLADRAVLTPHPGEFAALVGGSARDVDANRMEFVRTFVGRGSPTLVLKGRPTLIGAHGRPLCVNPTGNTGLATGGSGDVLTGLLAGLIAGGSHVADAAVASAYIHGLAADRWAAEASERALTPSDVIDALPRLLKELES